MNTLEAYLSDKQKRGEEPHPSEIAKILKDLNDHEFIEAVKWAPKGLIAAVTLELPDRYFDEILESFTSEELAKSVAKLDSDDKTDFIRQVEEFDKEKAKEILDLLDTEDQENILLLKRYDEDQAGAHMQLEVYSAKAGQRVNDVIKELAQKRKSGEIDNVNYLFVTDDDGYLRYGISLDNLILFDFDKTVEANIGDKKDDFRPISVRDTDNIDDVVKMFQEYDLSTMPVVDDKGKLLGRITSDDIYDLITEQATGQIYSMAGVSDDAEEDDDLLRALKSRAIWLGINLVTAIAASLVIGIFENTLQSYVALAILMPIVASMGGNAGTQSLTVVVRQLALGEISKNDALRTIKKEVLLSLGNGFIFAVVIGIVAWVWFDKPMLGVVIALSMIINLLSAGLFGAIIPLTLKKLGLDPAIGSTVILTTVTDIVGFFSFLGLATLILL